MFFKKFLLSFLFLAFITLIASCSKPSETVSGNGQTVSDFLLFEKSILLPENISKGRKTFSEVTIIYDSPPKEWEEGEGTMIWEIGDDSDPDSQISFLFKLRNDTDIAQK
jgi:hypothetical protein